MPALTVSDHALLRYLERAYNLDVEKLRAEIYALPGLAAAAAAGARSFSRDGLTFRLSESGNIITVQPHGSPGGARREAGRLKYGVSARMRQPERARRGDRRPERPHDFDEAAE
jgi:hypothetical protein